jgi:phytanoyl-CoA hydroxylase
MPPYPTPTPEIAERFARDGFVVVEDAIPVSDLKVLDEAVATIINDVEEYAIDWAWEEGKDLAEREFRFIQASPSRIWPELLQSRMHTWFREYGSQMLGQAVEFWYDHFIGKAPESNIATRWHQDEAYWGRALDNKGITCWVPLHDVDETNGCMRFVRGGHKMGIIEHRQPEGIKANMLYCDVPEGVELISTPIRRGSVTFHHSKTIHMTWPNVSQKWRRIVTQHLKAVGVDTSSDNRDHYPWKVVASPESWQASRSGRSDLTTEQTLLAKR